MLHCVDLTQDPSLFSVAVEKLKSYNIQDYNFGCSYVWVCNLVSEIKGEHRLGVFENRLLRRIFGPKREGDRRMKETAY
jgi:hypothetical protein